MTNSGQYRLGEANAEQLCRFWSARVDALERHLSVHTWALMAISALVIVYPVAPIEQIRHGSIRVGGWSLRQVNRKIERPKR